MDKELMHAHWPQTGDSLFASGPDWENEAGFVSIGHPFLTYALNYKNVADATVENVQGGQLRPDAVVYAVCFLYRHYLELMLKGLIVLGNEIERGNRDYPKTHKPPQLWEQCRAVLERAFPEGEKADTDAIEKCIKEFAALDPSGEAFRYGEDRQGRQFLPDDKKLNLRNMREVMSRMEGFLTGSYDAMDHLLQTDSN